MGAENDAYASRSKGSRLVVDAVDAEHGKYRGRAVSCSPAPEVPTPAPAQASPEPPRAYNDRAQGLTAEERTGLDVVPPAPSPSPFVTR